MGLNPSTNRKFFKFYNSISRDKSSKNRESKALINQTFTVLFLHVAMRHDLSFHYCTKETFAKENEAIVAVTS